MTPEVKRQRMARKRAVDAEFEKLEPLTENDQKRWIAEHIPHRVRSVLPGLRLPHDWEVCCDVNVATTQINWRCMGSAIWEGRLTSMRWLIMLVGISADGKWKPTRPVIRDKCKDVFITRFKGGTGRLFPYGRNANKLARVWVGCSKATAHPTNRTRHPNVKAPELASALQLIVSHLQATIYNAAGKDLRDLTLTMKSPKELMAMW